MVSELGWGSKQLVLVEHSKAGELVLQIWSSVPDIVVSAKLAHGYVVVAWVARTRLWLHSETSYLNSRVLG